MKNREQKEEKRRKDREKWAASDAALMTFFQKPLVRIVLLSCVLCLIAWGSIWLFSTLSKDITAYEKGWKDTLNLPKILARIYEEAGKLGLLLIIAVTGLGCCATTALSLATALRDWMTERSSR